MPARGRHRTAWSAPDFTGNDSRTHPWRIRRTGHRRRSSGVVERTVRSIGEYYKETQVVLEDDDPDLPEPEDDYDRDDLEEDEEDAEDGPSIFDLFRNLWKKSLRHMVAEL